MNRQLPIVDIRGTSFYVDVLREELRQTEDAKNAISFNVFDQDGNGYTFLYDQETKNAPNDKSAIRELGSRYIWVTLPALMELDAEGIAMKYNIPLSVLCPDRAVEAEEDDEEAFYEDGIYG